jgi:hypothetical protein
MFARRSEHRSMRPTFSLSLELIRQRALMRGADQSSKFPETRLVMPWGPTRVLPPKPMVRQTRSVAARVVLTLM